LLPLFVGFLAIVISVVVGLVIWFLRGDQKISTRLRNRKIEIDPIFKDYDPNIGNQNGLASSKILESESNAKNSRYPNYRI
ncbi:hypothetical protein EBX93_12180, partial [bacterium]|nr:hypothetical protein [bacterium]